MSATSHALDQLRCAGVIASLSRGATYRAAACEAGISPRQLRRVRVKAVFLETYGEVRDPRGTTGHEPPRLQAMEQEWQRWNAARDGLAGHMVDQSHDAEDGGNRSALP